MLALLTLSAGCSTVFGPEPVQDSDLTGDASYAWNASAEVDGYVDVDRNEYTAIYRVANRTTGTRAPGERPTIELYGRDALGTDEPMQVRDVVFRYPNGTILEFRETGGEVRLVRVSPDGSVEPADDPDALEVTRTRKRTVVHLPANDTGRLAVTAPKNGKGVSTPTFVHGDYEMVLPESARVGVPLLAQVRPGGSETTVDDGRVHIHWSDVRAPAINVRYYLQRDLLLFGALAGGMAIAGMIGAGYYLLQIRETVRRREEVGLDVEVPDDDSDGPPPGMG